MYQIQTSLVPCAPSRCSLDARFWNGTTSLHSVKDRTVDLLGTGGCLFSKLETSMSAASSEHVQFGSNIFCFCCCCPGTHGGHYFDNLHWAHSCGRRSVVPAESSCPAEIQAALGFEANSGRGCLGICFEADRNIFLILKAFERSVIRIVGVCQPSLLLHMCSSSHLLSSSIIFTASQLCILTS